MFVKRKFFRFFFLLQKRLIKNLNKFNGKFYHGTLSNLKWSHNIIIHVCNVIIQEKRKLKN